MATKRTIVYVTLKTPYLFPWGNTNAYTEVMTGTFEERGTIKAEETAVGLKVTSSETPSWETIIPWGNVAGIDVKLEEVPEDG